MSNVKSEREQNNLVVAPKKLFIKDVAAAVDRTPHTVRNWEYWGILPQELLPARTERGWRWWTPEQVDLIKVWLIEADIRPGKALTGYDPSPAQVKQHIENMRHPHEKAA